MKCEECGAFIMSDDWNEEMLCPSCVNLLEDEDGKELNFDV